MQLAHQLDVVARAARNLAAHRLQASLAGTGIAIGIAAVTILVAVVAGFERDIESVLLQAGGGIAYFRPELLTHSSTPPLRFRFARGDTADVMTAAPCVVSATVEAWFRATEGSQGDENPVRVRAVYPESAQLRDWQVVAGRPITETDIATETRVAVVSADFGADSVLGVGSTVNLEGQAFTVIGITGDPTETVSRLLRADQGQEIALPMTTAVSVFGDNRVQPLGVVRMRSGTDPTRCLGSVRAHLARLWKLLPSEQRNLRFSSTLEEAHRLQRLALMAKLLVGFVGGIALFVAGVGVANVMLVSVASRTAEIGVKRAVGARRAEIFREFLTEAMVLVAVSGAIGVVAAVCIAGMIGVVARGILPPPRISPLTLLSTAATLAVVGVGSGLIPASRAARVLPAVALRAE